MRTRLEQRDAGCETNVSGSSLNFTDVKDLRSFDRVFPIRDWLANFPELFITEF